jgi:hypothetical protein
MFRGRFSTFSLSASNDEWISLSLKMVFGPWWTSSLLTQLAQIWRNEHWQWRHMQWWWLLRSRQSYVERTSSDTFIPLTIEMYGCFHFRFDSFLTTLCIDHYRAFSVVLFRPFNACFLLSTSHVRITAMCTSHNDFSTSYCTWLRFFIFWTHHS